MVPAMDWTVPLLPPPPNNPVDVTLFRESVFTEVTMVRISRWAHPGLPSWTLTPMTSGLISGLIRDTQTRPHQGAERDWRGTQGTLGPQTLEEAGRILPRALGGAWPCRCFYFRLWPPELGEKKFLLLSVICYSRSRKYRALLLLSSNGTGSVHLNHYLRPSEQAAAAQTHISLG